LTLGERGYLPVIKATLKSDGPKGGTRRGSIWYFMEKFDYALGKLSITTRAELELVELWGEVEIIHKQRVFLAIVCHCISE
jgi:hypothetical protein